MTLSKPDEPDKCSALCFLWNIFHNNHITSSGLRQHFARYVHYSRGPQLQDLMPEDLRRSRCNQNRNKEHDKCNLLESFQNHAPPTLQSVEKLFSTESVPGVKKVGDRCIKGQNNGKEQQPGWYTMQRGPLVVEPLPRLGFAVFPRLLHHH